MKLWVGLEKEGEFKGEQTLFIGDESITVYDIKDAIKKYPKITQLYFGAGKCTVINQYVVVECLSEYSKLKITLEVELSKFDIIDNFLYNKVYFILTINDRHLLQLKNKLDKQKVQLKLQSVNYNDKILMIQNVNKFDYVDMTKLKDKTYDGDIVLK